MDIEQAEVNAAGVLASELQDRQRPHAGL